MKLEPDRIDDPAQGYPVMRMEHGVDGLERFPTYADMDDPYRGGWRSVEGRWFTKERAEELLEIEWMYRDLQK